MKKTKIVSTLGPASNDIETITALAKAGGSSSGKGYWFASWYRP